MDDCRKVTESWFAPFAHACKCVLLHVNTLRKKQLSQWYLAGVLAPLLESSADHVRQDVHLFSRVRLVHRLTRTLGNDWHLNFLQSPQS